MDSNEPPSKDENKNIDNVKEIPQASQLSSQNENEMIINSSNPTDSSGIPPDPPHPPHHKWRWLKRLILLVCLLSLGVIGITQAPSASFVCQACHEMKPEIATWQVSSHSKIACIKCHPGIHVEHLFQLIHFTKKYYLPIQVKEPVPESICINCHSGNRVITPKGDLIVPHQKHEQEGITCTECHIGVAHGGIAERQETI